MQGEVTDIRAGMARFERSADHDRSARYRVLPKGPKQTTPGLFEKQVENGPDRPAVRSDGDQATYDQLNRLANRVGHAVVDRLGTAQEPVALAAMENIGLIAAMFGVMKANKILVTLSPLDPPERQVQMMKRSGAKLLIVDEAWRSSIGQPEIDGVETLLLNDLDPGLSEENLGLEIDPDGYARLLFTSGSTGEPKGVLKAHWVDSLFSKRPGFAFTDRDRIAQLFPPSFAAAPSSITAALLNGGVLCIYDVKNAGLHRLGDWIENEGITYIGIVPSFLRRFLEATPDGVTFPKVRTIVCGAEALLKKDVELFRRYFSEDCTFMNVLAATETDVSTYFVIDKDTEIPDQFVPVGFADENVELLVLDDDMQRVGLDEPGMLYIGSTRLAPGYWQDPENTAASFVPDPTGGPDTVYKTGDLAKLRADGCLIYLGRGDDRVKVRGYGVDLTEVQKALLEMPGIEEAAVVAKDTDGDDSKLVAYIVVDESAPSFGRGEIRAFLGNHLPPYAIPGMFVKLNALPITERGKVDKKALPDVDLIGPSRETEHVGPSDDVERTLLEIWQDVLKTPDIGVNDHFFDELAGSSVQGLQVFAEISNRLDLDLAPTTLLQSPTVAELAEIVRSGEGEQTSRSLIPVRSQGSKTPFFCVHGGGGGVFFVRDIAAHIPSDRPVYGLQAAGFDGLPSPYRPMEEIAARYLSEIRAVQPHGPYLLGGLSFGGLVAMEMAQQLKRQGEKTALVALLDTKIVYETDDDRTDPNRHLNRMKDMTLGQKVGYVVGGVWRRFYRTYREWRVQMSLRAFHRLPKNLRKFHFFPMFAQAAREYEPQPYQGDVLLISEKGAQYEQEAEWLPLIDGNVESHEIPVGHFDLVKEPHVGTLGSYLVAALDRAENDNG